MARKTVRQMYTQLISPLLLSISIGMFSLVSFSSPDAVAQTPDQETKAAMAEGFVPVEGGQPVTEEVNASMLVVAAYGAFALGFILYILHLGRQQAVLANELVQISTRIDTANRRES